MDFFAQQWSTYRAVVDHDLMEHRGLSAAIQATLSSWLAARGPQAPAPTLVDLGCGDLAQLGPLLRSLPLASYSGLDLTAAVLPLASAQLQGAAFPCHWRCGDLLAWAQGALADDPNPLPVDLIHSSFAVHHLNDTDKRSWLEGCRRRIRPDGLLLWADVFRPAGETREAYLQRYLGRVEQGWSVLSPEQRQLVQNHVGQYDLPAERGVIETAANQAGWHWRWAWQGSHGAEALALLTPA